MAAGGCASDRNPIRPIAIVGRSRPEETNRRFDVVHLGGEASVSRLPEVHARGGDSVLDEDWRDLRLGAGPPCPAVDPDQEGRVADAGRHVDVQTEISALHLRVDHIAVLPISLDRHHQGRQDEERQEQVCAHGSAARAGLSRNRPQRKRQQPHAQQRAAEKEERDEIATRYDPWSCRRRKARRSHRDCRRN